MAAEIINTPLIAEFPWNIECKIVQTVELGSHHCFFGKVVAVHAQSETILKNKIDPTFISQIGYINGKYVPQEKEILAKHGFSLKQKRKS
jgi:flavin reductase (DIM6/NTAB) family NADH-FMN oxidoreductase RutF